MSTFKTIKIEENMRLTSNGNLVNVQKKHDRTGVWQTKADLSVSAYEEQKDLSLAALLVFAKARMKQMRKEYLIAITPNY